MIENDKQRRWWFANHPEYSSSKGRRKLPNNEEPDGHEKVSPESVDAYVDEALKHVSGTVAVLLKSFKRNFGTEGYAKESHEEEEEHKNREEVDYQKGWDDGYRAIRRNQAPPEWVIEDKSAYARGVREGATTALDEREAWAQKWIDPLLMTAGTSPSNILGKNLTDANLEKPSADYDAHHLVPWRHWRAQIARDILEKWGIEINSIENGMWLDRTFHRTLSNNHKYMRNITSLLQKAQSRPEALRVLQQIRDSLSKMKIPQ